MARRLLPRPIPTPFWTQLSSTLVRAPLFLAGTALCGSASLLASLFEKDGRMQHRIAQAWARASMRFAGAPLRVVGDANLHQAPVAVYASNHLSYMDTPAIFSALPFQFRIVARHNLWKVPFIGWHLHRSGTDPRKRRQSARFNCQPVGRCQNAPRWHAPVHLSGRWTDANGTARQLPERPSLHGDSRPGSDCAHGTDRNA